ncbi:hypothetical protein, partial [Roseiconus lacunae]
PRPRYHQRYPIDSMDLDAIRESLSKLDAEHHMDLGDARPETIERLQSVGLPEDLVELVTKCWPQTPNRGHAGPYGLAASAQLVTPNLETEIANHGLFFFSSAGNGDSVAIEVNLPDYPVLIFDHSNWDNDLTDIRSIAVGLALTLDEFFARVANDPEMPGDYWDVRYSLHDSG